MRHRTCSFHHVRCTCTRISEDCESPSLTARKVWNLCRINHLLPKELIFILIMKSTQTRIFCDVPWKLGFRIQTRKLTIFHQAFENQFYDVSEKLVTFFFSENMLPLWKGIIPREDGRVRSPSMFTFSYSLL